MNGQRFPLHRLPNDLCSEVLKTMDHHEIIFYSFLSKKATSMVTALQLHISYVVMRMDEPAVIRLQIENRYIEFILEMHRNNKKITNLNELPVSVKMKKVKGTSEFESTLSNQQMFLGDWIKHFFSFSVNLEIDFHVGNTEFDIQAVRNTLPKLQLISLFCSKDEPNESDILNTQNFLRAFLSDAQNLELHSVPLQENFSLQHIGMINLKELQLYYQNNLNFVDAAAWNVESCFITTMDDQVSLRDLNRFFKLWTK